jgi:hypothetical protein
MGLSEQDTTLATGVITGSGHGVALQVMVLVALHGKPTVVKVNATESPSLTPFTVKLDGATWFPVTAGPPFTL